MCSCSPRFRCLILQLILVLASMSVWAADTTLPPPATRGNASSWLELPVQGPATLISLGEAADAPQWDWQNDPAKPWMPLALPDPAGDMVVSPPLESGESTRFSTVVHGPGTVTFHWHDFDGGPVIGTFSADGEVLHTSTNGPEDQLVEVFIPVSSAVTLEWTATASTEWDVRNSLIGVDKVSFTAWPVYPLAAALDAPASVTWQTSSEIPFTGRTDLNSKGQTSAYVGLLPGESSWLEATVDGPGLFDFWLRKQVGIDLPGNLWNFWSLTIDGQPVAMHDTVWPALWITGPGPHRIRFTLRNPTDGISRQWLASGVDDVSWVPLKTTSLKSAGGLAGKSWKTGSTLPAVGLRDSGRDGDPAILLRPGQAAPSWVGLKLQGPCEISWDSALDETEWSAYSEHFLRVDGIKVVPIRPHPWQRMRLTLPAGYHSVRWLTKPRRIVGDSDSAHPQLAFAAWRLGGFAIQQGITPLARALDFSGLFAMETGDTGGQLVSVGNADAWQPGAATSLYFFDPRHAGKLTSVWGRPGIIAGDWTYHDENGTRYPLWSESGAWQSHLTSLAPGTAVRWSYTPQIWQGAPSRQPPLLKSIKFKATLAVPLANAIEAPRPLVADGWCGLIDRAAVANQTSAWSLLNQPGMTHSATLTVTGPAQVSFWWKASGPSTLRLSLDGGHLPVAEPGASWTKIEFAVGAGDHLVHWTHVATAGAGFSTSGEARLDGLEIRKATPSSLTQATVIGAGLDLTSAAPELKPWQPVAYQEANGAWTHAARAVGGSPVLRTAVTGPAILEFRGRCFEGFPSSPRAGSRSSVGVIIGGGTQVVGHVLAVEVGGVEKLRIPANPSGAWQNGAVHVPTGNHEVTFRLITLRSSLFGEVNTYATASTLQGWVDDLQLVSPASRYQTWAKNLPHALSGQDTDADADGASNFLEYTFGTAPLDPTSRPPALVFGFVSQRFGGSYPELRIPYLPPHASGALESSTDLIHWQPESAPSLYFRRSLSPLSLYQSTSTYQSVAVPIVGPQKFYRLSMSAVPPAE